MFRSSLFYLAGRYGGSAITLLSISAITRLVPPAEYGVFALSLSAGSLLYSALLYWIRDSLLRFMPNHREDEGRLLSQLGIGYVAVACVTIAVAGIALSLDLGVQTRRVVMYAAITFLALSLGEITLALLQSRLQAARYAKLSLVRALVTATCSVGLAWSGFGAAGLVAGTVAGYLISAAPILVDMRNLVSPRRFDGRLMREVLGYGLGFSAIGGMIAFNTVADRYIVGWLYGSAAAGLYAAPYDLTTRSLQVLMLAVNLAGTPLIFRAFDAGGAAEALPILRRQFTLLVGVGLPAAVGMAIMARFTTTLLLGKDFQSTGEALMPYIAAATVLQSLELFYFSFAFSLTRQPLGQFLVLVPTAFLNVGLNMLLIPYFGLIGAAYATLASYACSLAAMVMIGRSRLPLPLPLVDLAKVALACAAMAAVLWPARDWTGWPALGLCVGVAGPVYLVAVLVLDVGGIRHGAAAGIRALQRRLRRPIRPPEFESTERR